MTKETQLPFVIAPFKCEKCQKNFANYWASPCYECNGRIIPNPAYHQPDSPVGTPEPWQRGAANEFLAKAFSIPVQEQAASLAAIIAKHCPAAPQPTPEPNRDAELRAVVRDFLQFVAESEGVTGWHMNGDVCRWEQVEQIQAMTDLSVESAPQPTPDPAAWNYLPCEWPPLGKVVQCLVEIDFGEDGLELQTDAGQIDGIEGHYGWRLWSSGVPEVVPGRVVAWAPMQPATPERRAALDAVGGTDAN